MQLNDVVRVGFIYIFVRSIEMSVVLQELFLLDGPYEYLNCVSCIMPLVLLWVDET